MFSSGKIKRSSKHISRQIISLVIAKGVTPAQQSVDGARKSTLNIPEGEILTPNRNGYKFVGWYYEDEEGIEHPFVNNTIAESWIYYAKWEPIKYSIVLHSNESTDATKTITNVKYDDFVPLSGSEFTSEESGKILAGWKTQANGEGTDYAANESVCKLTVIDGDAVDLWAMWRTPDVIITFDSDGGTFVDQKDYTLIEGQKVPYGILSEPVKDGYTFDGWYTDDDRKVVLVENHPESETAYVSESRTLTAHWKKKPIIRFVLNGGKIKDSTDDYIKVIDYDQSIGSVPTPDYGNQTFMGWYTEETGGSLVSDISEHTVTAETETYYAHWGWKPRFQTDGGSFVTAPAYTTQVGNSNYNLGTLPEVEREYYVFLGWYIGDTKVEDNQIVDLANGCVFTARWKQKKSRSC